MSTNDRGSLDLLLRYGLRAQAQCRATLETLANVKNPPVIYARQAAAYALADLMRGKTINCEDRGHDRYGRSIGLCRAAGRDLGADMVSAGMAWAFTRYSSDYVGQERTAIGAKLGVHAHDCEKPWDWRARNRSGR